MIFAKCVEHHCSKIRTKPAPWRGFYIIPWQKPAEAEAEDLERAPFGTAVAWSKCGERSKDQGLTMGTKPSGDVVFFWDKILSMSKDLRKKNRLLNKTLFVQLFDTFVTVVGSF